MESRNWLGGDRLSRKEVTRSFLSLSTLLRVDDLDIITIYAALVFHKHSLEDVFISFLN